MISDVLSDAVGEIDRYQLEMKDSYDGLQPEIEVVRTVMSALRVYLDVLSGHHRESDQRMQELRNTLRNLDVSRLRSIMEEQKRWAGGMRNFENN